MVCAIGNRNEIDMKRKSIIWLLVLSFVFLPGSVYAGEVVTVPEKPAVEESPAEREALTGTDERIQAVETGPAEEQTEEDGEIAGENGIADPLEPWNRAMFTVNDKLYFWVLKPVAKGYSAIVPEWGRVRVKNIFQNITMPVRFVNNLLQLKIKDAGTELLRFVFNTTAGVGGMFDVAKNIDLEAQDEDFGQTLGVFGIGNGFYVVWPLLGPSSLRDTVGLAGDFFLDPVNYITPAESRIAVRSVDITNQTSLRIGDYEDMKESALDPYVSFRSAYFEHRNSKIKE